MPGNWSETFCDHVFLKPVVAKLKRANSQGERVFSDLKQYLEDFQLDTKVVMSDDRLNCKIYIVEIDEDALIDLSLLIGEFVHNLRSALDNLAYALARLDSDPPKNPDQISFPIFIDEKDYVAKWVNRRKPERFREDVSKQMHAIQPFQAVDPVSGKVQTSALALVSAVSNQDKHRIPQLLLCSQRKADFSLDFEFHEGMADDVIPKIVYTDLPLTSGMVLIECEFTSPLKRLTANYSLDFGVNIEINGEIFNVLEFVDIGQQTVIQACSLFNKYFKG